MPLGQVFLSGVFTGMVTTITLVNFFYNLDPNRSCQNSIAEANWAWQIQGND